MTVPFPSFPEYDAGPPVTEGAGVRVRGMDGTLEGSPERRHRARHLASTTAADMAAGTELPAGDHPVAEDRNGEKRAK